MPESFTTTIKNLNPKAQLVQSWTSLAKLTKAADTLPLFRLSLLLTSLLGALSLEIKNTLLLLGETAAASRLLKIEGFESPRALNADDFKNTSSIFAFHQEAKQFLLPFDLQKQNKPRFGIALGGKAPEARLHS